MFYIVAGGSAGRIREITDAVPVILPMRTTSVQDILKEEMLILKFGLKLKAHSRLVFCSTSEEELQQLEKNIFSAISAFPKDQEVGMMTGANDYLDPRVYQLEGDNFNEAKYVSNRRKIFLQSKRRVKYRANIV